MGFGERLQGRVEANGSPLVVGIDPHRSRLPEPIVDGMHTPERALATWGCGVVEAVAPHAVAVKPPESLIV